MSRCSLVAGSYHHESPEEEKKEISSREEVNDRDIID
jgi:hypothetical protein